MGMEALDFTKDKEGESNEVDVSSANKLLEDIKALEGSGNQEGQVGLVEEIKLKISDLEDIQKFAPNSQNVRKALSELRGHLQRLTN